MSMRNQLTVVMIEKMRAEIDRRLQPWTDQLGPDRTAYTHHVLRVLTLCDWLAPAGEPAPSTREEFLTAVAFHDLGVWSHGTADYLAPSIELASAWLDGIGRTDLTPSVSRMIDLHHKIRPAGAPDDPVEILRRADAIDVEVGLLGRFGVPRARYRELAQQYPNAGFHRRLLRLGAQRLRTNPTSPLPMFKW